MRRMNWIAPAGLTALVLGVATVVLMGPALASQPQPWQLGFQDSASPTMTEIVSLHNFLLWIIAAISIFVLGLLVWVAVKFNRRANPNPESFTHNTLIEVVWTVVPVLILVVIAVPSFRLLYFLDTIPPEEEVGLTIKATGYQWYWTYQYPDIYGDEEFIATMIEEEDLGVDAYGDLQPRLLATTADVVVPVGTNVRVIVHAWAVPAFGVKMDAVPGRLNETWFKAERTGMFYGQCSELCGVKHAFMPISVRVVTQQEFDQWVADTSSELGLAANDGSDILVQANAE